MRSVLVLAAVAAVALSSVVQVPMRKAPSLRAKLIREGTIEQALEQIHLDRARSGYATTASQPFIDYFDDFYLGDIGVGTPYQNFTIVLDTGSSNLWLISSTCTTQACKGYSDSGYTKHQYNTAKSSTYESSTQKFSISYGSGSCSGTIGYDKLNLAGLVYAKQGLGVSTTIADVFGHQPMDGILGLGWPALAVDNVEPPIQNLLSQLTKPLFTVWLDRHVKPEEDKLGGLITYGATDSKNCDSTITYVALTAKTYWQFQLDGFSTGSYKSTSKQQAISDTGTSWIAAPKAAVNGIVAQTGAKYNSKEGVYEVPCSGKYDDWVFTIGGKAYNVPSTEYVIDLSLGGGNCALTLMSMSGGGLSPDWILGDTWIRTYCQVYDVGDAKIGFAKAHHSEI